MESPDIHAKYQKLAAEYSKLRAQNQVLKKGVVDEQAKTTQLTDVLKARDQTLRKAEQENDSLAFRNQQLTKRLMLLQEDLDDIQSKSRKGRGKADSVTDNVPPTDDVFTEELQLKIQENARLKSELSDLEGHYARRIAELEGQVESSAQEARHVKAAMQDREKSANDVVDQLESERVRQEVVAQQREAEVRALQQQVAALTKPGEACRCGAQPADNNEVDGQTKPALDMKLSSSNLKIPFENGSVESPTVSTRNILESFDGVVQELCRSFAQFVCAYATRVRLYDQTTAIKDKLIEALNSSASPWHSLALAFHQMASSSSSSHVTLDDLSGLGQVSRHVTSCGAALRRVLPLVVHWVSEGGRGGGECERVGAAWCSAFSRLVSAWGSLAPYVATLANQSSSQSSLPSSAQGRVISMLSDRLANLHAALRDAGSSYVRKAESEVDLPSTSGEAKAADCELTKVLDTLALHANKMATVFKEQVVPSWSRTGSTPTTPSSTPSSTFAGMPYSLKSRGKFASSQDEDHPEDLTSPSDDTQALTKQLAMTSAKLSQLEAEREHWRLEHQLLQCRHMKEAKRVRQLERELRGEGGRSEADPDTQPRDHSSSVVVATSILGEVQGCEQTVDEREKDIRSHFTSRCSHLYMQLTAATSQATLFQNECESLMRRLAISEETRTTCEGELDKQRENTNAIKETLQTTSRNYEEQISTMSEHLADLNEKLTGQAEFIEQLKYEIKNKKKK